MYQAALTKSLLLSFLVLASLQIVHGIRIPAFFVSTPSAANQVKDPSYIFCDYINRITVACKLHDGVTNEGLAFNSDHFVQWNKSFWIVFYAYDIPLNHCLTRIDIYYYSNPSLGYGLYGTSRLKVFNFDPYVDHIHFTFINNYEVSQSDNGTRKLSMIALNPKPLTHERASNYYIGLNFFLTSSDLVTQSLISEIRFFSDKDPIPFSPVPIVFKSPNETLELNTVQSSLNLSCTVVNNGTFSWTWTGPGVSNGVIKVADTTRTSILMLSSISVADAGDYTCSASYLAMGKSAWGVIEPKTNTRTISLILFNSVSTATDTVIVEEGNDATLSCLFTGYLPKYYEVGWSGIIQAGSEVMVDVQENTQFKTQHGGSSTSPGVESIFMITSAKVADSGLYTCSMRDITQRKTILLMVVTQRRVWQVELE